MLLGPDPPVDFPWYGSRERTQAQWEAFKLLVGHLDIPVHGTFCDVQKRAVNATKLAQAWNEWDEKRWFNQRGNYGN